jgi:hypothetical protein
MAKSTTYIYLNVSNTGPSDIVALSQLLAQKSKPIYSARHSNYTEIDFKLTTPLSGMKLYICTATSPLESLLALATTHQKYT